MSVKFRIEPQSEVPLHMQLREQIIFKTSTCELKPGDLMPSVRQLERHLHIHRNTISDVYSELAREGWLVQQPSRRYAVVQKPLAPPGETFRDIDELIDKTIQTAHEHGYSVQMLADKLRQRLMAEPPDHLLIIEPDQGMGMVMKAEIGALLGRVPKSCCLPSLLCDPSQAMGAALLVPWYIADRVVTIPAKYRIAVVQLHYTSLEPYIAEIMRLKKASIIGMVSVSMPGMKTATGMIASALGTHHWLSHFLMTWSDINGRAQAVFKRLDIAHTPADAPIRLLSPRAMEESAARHAAYLRTLPKASMDDLCAMDLLLCDSVTYAIVEHRKKVRYPLLSKQSLMEVEDAARTLRHVG